MVGVFKAGEKGQKNTQGGSGQANDQSERSEDQGSAEVSREERESKAEAHQAWRFRNQRSRVDPDRALFYL